MGGWLTASGQQCNGSDVFGSDICTCRPYLIFGIEEAVKEAQNGGSGVVIYFRKEGRALGEVTKVRDPVVIRSSGDGVKLTCALVPYVEQAPKLLVPLSYSPPPVSEHTCNPI